MSIKRFFIIANRVKDQDQVFSGKIRDYLNNKGMTCHIVHLEEERIRLIKDFTPGGRGADIVVECVGRPEVFPEGLR